MADISSKCYNVPSAIDFLAAWQKVSFLSNIMTRFLSLSVAFCYKFEMLTSQGNAGTSRTCRECGGKYYMSFVENLILFSMVQRILKID